MSNAEPQRQPAFEPAEKFGFGCCLVFGAILIACGLWISSAPLGFLLWSGVVGMGFGLVMWWAAHKSAKTRAFLVFGFGIQIQVLGSGLLRTAYFGHSNDDPNTWSHFSSQLGMLFLGMLPFLPLVASANKMADSKKAVTSPEQSG